jgi:replicative DNA helicase
MYMDALQIGSDGLMKKDDALKLKAQQILDERAKVSIDTDLGLDLDDLDTMIEYYSERMTGIRTQHNELNKRLGPGFLPGTLSVILAASGVGKSLLMTDLVSGMLTTGKNILLVSLEMADKEIMKRVHANAMNLPINSLLDLSKTEGELAKLNRPIIDKAQIISAYERMKTSGTCGKFFVKDYPSGSFSPLMLEQLVESYRIERNINFDIVFVDYIGIMKSDLLSPSAGLYSYVKSIAEEVRATAKKLQIPIISASQLNRCFHQEAVLITEDGEKLANDINIGDRIKSYDRYNTVMNVTYTGKQKAYKITTKSGKTFICSGNHKFPTKKCTNKCTKY